MMIISSNLLLYSIKNNSDLASSSKMEGDGKGPPLKRLEEPQQQQDLQVFDRICNAGRFDEDEGSTMLEGETRRSVILATGGYSREIKDAGNNDDLTVILHFKIFVKDVWKEYTGWPLNDMENQYKFMVKHVDFRCELD
ncbi:hypothetical protein Tco_0581276 [Tanacetum coccineum]